MKTTLTFLLAILAVTMTFAQEKSAPRSEFLLELSQSTLELKPGETSDIKITLNRSKSFSKSKAVLGLSSGLPPGVTVTFEPSEGILESSVAKIAVAEHTKPGNYTIILNGTIQHKNKGATLKLIVSNHSGTGAVTSVN